MIDLFDIQIAIDYKLALIFAAVLAGGLIRGFAGFGSALLIVPAFALVFSPREAVAMEVIIEIPAMLTLMPAAVRDAQRPLIRPMLLSLILTVPLGALALVTFDDAIMKIAISIAVLLMVVILALQREVKALISKRLAIAAAIASGLIQGSTGVGGPPAVVTLLALGENSVVSRANVIAFMTGMLSMSLVSMALYGLLTREVIVIGLLASPVLLISVFIGMAGFRQFGDRWLRPVALAMVALTALVTLASALLVAP